VAWADAGICRVGCKTRGAAPGGASPEGVYRSLAPGQYLPRPGCRRPRVLFGPIKLGMIAAMRWKRLGRCWCAILALGATAAGTQNFRPPLTTIPEIAFLPPVDDYYPNTSKHLGETGTAGINACYGPDGRVVTVEVATSSGHPD